jgi:hypothetical protein
MDDNSDINSDENANQFLENWNEYLVSVFIGLPNTDIPSLLLHPSFAPALPPDSPVFPPASASASASASSPPLTGQVHYLENNESPTAKRHQIQPSVIRIPRKITCYRYLKLRSGVTFHFSDDDGKDILTTPVQEPNLFIRKLLSRIPRGVRDRLTFLSQFSDNHDATVEEVDWKETDELIIPTAVDLDPTAYLFTDLREQLFTAYLREMRMRRAFRSLLQRWRLRRIDKKEHTRTDPITLVEPIKSVMIYDVPRMARFEYDARSLAAWIESNLMYYEGGFALPRFPRNPWTNLEFTERQLLSIYEQLRTHGELRWGLTTLRAYQFHLSRWKLFHHSALTLSAVRKSLTRLDSADARDLLEDFIFAKMEDLHIYTSPSIRQVYRTAIRHAPTHWYLEEFKAVAYLHYEAEHFQQDRRRMIHNRCDRIFDKQDLFISDIQRMSILVSVLI